ncbi:hypothetical protein GCM10029963_73630 [Micromonospora andamanensis]|uniref:ApeA N-terminal domain 1-containing protein n=1 Tax=Micromonospora andamanensis TaxID=1287068 RepID=UPI001A5F5823|nr:HEPN domain-containing protein [Micromonospora andamanensis]GIJ42696.1 hypothetical protein Vwe01_60210 [Micromonospora andamanensis]
MTTPERMLGSGIWWVPGNDASVVRGTLSINDAGVPKLVTDEDLPAEWIPESVREAAGDGYYFEVIHGKISSDPITLISCTLFVDYPGWSQATALSRGTLDYAWVSGHNDAAFVQARIGIDNAASWGAQHSLTVNEASESERSERAPVTLVAATFPESQVTTVSDIQVGISWHLTREVAQTHRGNDVHLREVAFFTLDSADGFNLDQLDTFVRALQDLLTFAAGRECAVHQIALEVNERTGGRVWNYESGFHPTLYLYINKRYSSTAESSYVPGARMLFRLTDVDFRVVIERWFALQERFRAVLGTLLLDRYSTRQTLENRTIATVTAIEQSYRSLDLPEHFVSEKVLRRLRGLVRHAIEGDEELAMHSLRISQQIDRRITLDDRIRGVLDNLGEGLGVLFADEESKERWIVAAKRARNDLAHTGRTVRYDADALKAISKTAIAVLELTILKELGLSEYQLISTVQRCRRNIIALQSAIG